MLRKLLVFIHRWAGLTLGLFAVVLAVSGAGLALRPLLDGVVNPAEFTTTNCTAPLTLEQQAAAARAFHPRGQVALVEIAPDRPMLVRFGNGDQAFIDRCSGAVLSTQGRFEGIFGRLDQLHRLGYWPNGPFLKLIKGSTALGLGLISVVGGVYLWWPRRRLGWRRAFTVERSLKGRAFALNLHWTTGLYTALILLVITTTGSVIAFDWAKQGLYLLTASRPPAMKFASSVPEEGAAPLPLDTAWQRLVGVMPNPAEITVHYPRERGAPIEIYAVARDAPHGDARSFLALDAAGGTVLSWQPYEDLSDGRKLYYWLLAIHTGKAGGWPVDLLLFLGAIGVPVMAYTGIESWLRRARRKRAPAAKLQAAE
jgi:uncharacterized iron-regulated membrane protein